MDLITDGLRYATTIFATYAGRWDCLILCAIYLEHASERAFVNWCDRLGLDVGAFFGRPGDMLERNLGQSLLSLLRNGLFSPPRAARLPCRRDSIRLYPRNLPSPRLMSQTAISDIASDSEHPPKRQKMNSHNKVIIARQNVRRPPPLTYSKPRSSAPTTEPFTATRLSRFTCFD